MLIFHIVLMEYDYHADHIIICSISDTCVEYRENDHVFMIYDSLGLVQTWMLPMFIILIVYVSSYYPICVCSYLQV